MQGAVSTGVMQMDKFSEEVRRGLHDVHEIGGKLSMVVNSSVGVFGPYVTAQWMHEFKNDTPSIVSKYVADPTNNFFAIPTATPTRDYAVLAVGTSVTLPNNLSGFAQFSGAAGLKNESNYGIVLGVRKQF